jgi:hypothetical protein
VEFGCQFNSCSRTEEKQRKPLIELTARRTFRMTTDFKVKVTMRLTVSQSALVSRPHLGLMTRYLLLFDSYSVVIVGRPL